MARANDISYDAPYFRRLTDSQLDRLHQATLDILETIGIRFPEPAALDIFRQAGAVVEDDLVRIPAWRVEWALRSAPKRLHLYTQDGQPAMRLEGRCAFFGNGSDLLYILDHRTGQRRLAVLQDVYDMAQVANALEHIDFVMSGFLPRDVPVERAERLQMQAMLRTTHKPLLYVTTDSPNTQAAVAMAEAAAGGSETLRQRPFIACYINITSPLQHNPESIEKLIWLSSKGLPLTYRPAMVTRGISTPITPAGFLALNNAGCLAGLVLSQLVREGTPFIHDSCGGGTFDMQHMVGQYSAPEIRGFREDLLHYYRLPGFGIGGTTGAKTIDSQSAYEAALTLITAVQAGGQLIHDVGYMDNGLTGSLVQLAICNEIVGWIKAYMRPIVIDDETLALDAVREAAQQQTDFLGSENTARHFREDFYPKLASRENYDSWVEAGALSLEGKAKAALAEILDIPLKNRLSPEQDRAVQAVVDA